MAGSGTPAYQLWREHKGCDTGRLPPCPRFASVKSEHCKNNNHTACAHLNPHHYHQSNGFWSILDGHWLLLHCRGRKRNCTDSGILPLRLALDAVVLACDFSMAFSIRQGMLRAWHTGDLRCCPATLSNILRGNGVPCRRPLLFSHIKTLTPNFC